MLREKQSSKCMKEIILFLFDKLNLNFNKLIIFLI